MKIGRWELLTFWGDWFWPWNPYTQEFRVHDWILAVGPFQVRRWAKESE